MKIAYVVPMTWACGGILVPFHHVNELAARGHELTVFAPPGSEAAWFPLPRRCAPSRSPALPGCVVLTSAARSVRWVG